MAEVLNVQPKKIEGKVAIVTGGASGIGEATANLFACQGARAVVIADIQDKKGQDVANAIGSHLCSYFHCDVTDEAQVKAMVDWTVTTYGRLDIMFSNAGKINFPDQLILDLDMSMFDSLFAVNVRGMALCVKHAARAMVEGHVKGSIVCTASTAGRRGTETWIDYTMSKHAVIGLVRSASKQLGKYGVRVNGVSPYVVATPMTCNWMGMGVEEAEKIYEPFTHLKGTVLKAKHVADAVVFLASDDSAFITGHDIVVDGGFIA